MGAFEPTYAKKKSDPLLTTTSRGVSNISSVDQLLRIQGQLEMLEDIIVANKSEK
jgi:hypothetical protein